jgi:hypothetical protein
MKDMLVPIEARRKSLDMTLIDALDYMVANRNQSLVIEDVEQELV